MTVVFQLPQRAPREEMFAVGCSPLAEAVFSLRVLANPAGFRAHAGWIRTCRTLPRDVRRTFTDLTPLFAHRLPGFLTATRPTSSSYADELARAAATPPEQARAEVLDVLRTSTAELRVEWETEPRAALERLVDFIERYWAAVFEREWTTLAPRLRSAMRRSAEELRLGRSVNGLAGIRLADNSLVVPRRCKSRSVVEVRGEAITFAPSAFLWPRVSVESARPWPFAVFYPLPPTDVVAADGELLPRLRALADGTRLALIRLIIERPRSTKELSELVSVSEAAVSQHLRQLRAAGLVVVKREGHYVLYSVEPRSIRRVAASLSDLLAQ